MSGLREERVRAGTIADRRKRTVGVYYAIAILVAFIAAYGAWRATVQSDSTAEIARQSALSVQQTARVERSSTTLTRQVAALLERVQSDEKQTCLIQARGLPAGHELAASMREIHRLLTLTPTTKAQRLAARNTPRSVKLVVAHLNQHLAAYLAAEDAQPSQRNC